MLTLPLPPEPLRLMVNVLPSFISDCDVNIPIPETVIFSGSMNDTIAAVYSTLARKLQIDEKQLFLCSISHSEVYSISYINITHRYSNCSLPSKPPPIAVVILFSTLYITIIIKLVII